LRCQGRAARRVEQGEEAAEELDRRGRAAFDMKVDWDDGRNRADHDAQREFLARKSADAADF
jgi:hypothetical protein